MAAVKCGGNKEIPEAYQDSRSKSGRNKEIPEAYQDSRSKCGRNKGIPREAYGECRSRMRHTIGMIISCRR